MAAKQQKQVDVWEKWNWLWNAIFYLTVVASVTLMLFDGNRSAPAWVAGLLSAVMLLWHWAGLRFADQGPEAWNEHATVRFIIITGDIILWYILVNITPAYYFALFGLFMQVFRQLPVRYAVVATVLLTAAAVLEQLGDGAQSFSLASPALWAFLFMCLASLVLGIWISAIIQQSTQRRELIEQLEATQAELAAAQRREGVLAERQRLAQEIHDTLAQGFTSIVLHLEAAEQALPGDLDTVQNHLDHARSTARTSLDQARRVVQDLRPDLLEQQSLPHAIERTAERWKRETGIPLAIQTTGSPIALHPHIEVTLLRAAQESLNNIRKYARATAVQLTLSYMPDLVILDVQDNGVGLNGAKPSPLAGGYGLQAMRERAESLGGNVTLESEPGEGTTVVVAIPLTGHGEPALGSRSPQTQDWDTRI